MSEVASSQLEPVEATSIQLPTSSRYGNDLALSALAVVICVNVEPKSGLLFNFGGKALQQVIGLIQFVLKEAINFLG